MKFVIQSPHSGVEHKKLKTKFALKEMRKTKILAKKSVTSVMNERQILSLIHHPFIVNTRPRKSISKIF